MAGKPPRPSHAVPAAGAVYRLLQLLHATAQAGWWQTEDGRAASFTDVARTVLEGSGTTNFTNYTN